MTQEERDIRRKLRIFKHAEERGNVSKPVGILEYPDPHIMAGNEDMHNLENPVLSTAILVRKIQNYV